MAPDQTLAHLTKPVASVYFPIFPRVLAHSSTSLRRLSEESRISFPLPGLNSEADDPVFFIVTGDTDFLFRR